MESRLQNPLTYSEYRMERNRNRRLRHFHRQCFMLVLTVILILTLTISYHAIVSKATSSDEPVVYKYYKSIEISYGDSLWSIAETYAAEEYTAIQNYIKEVMLINHLTDTSLTAGEYLIIPYYTTVLQ